MSKTLFFSAFAVLILTASFPAAAQTKPASEMPAGGPKVPVVAAPVGAYNTGVAPINLKPRMYINRNPVQPAPQPTAANTAAGRLSFPVENKTSAAAYNQRLVSTQLAAKRKKESVIPSPFPDGF